MTHLKNDTFLRALLRQPTEYTPVWMMRQAGRYLPEYNETRKRAGSFLQLCKNPDLRHRSYACNRWHGSRSMPPSCSPISSPCPMPWGWGCISPKAKGPKFERPLREEWEIRDLAVPTRMRTLRYVLDAVSEIRKALDGECAADRFLPAALGRSPAYMVEGGAAPTSAPSRRWLYQRPDLLHHVLDVTAQAVTAYLNAQIEAGAQAVMIFDSWGGALSHAAYREFSLGYMERIVSGLIREREGRRVPSIVFTKGGGSGWSQWRTSAPMRSGWIGR